MRDMPSVVWMNFYRHGERWMGYAYATLREAKAAINSTCIATLPFINPRKESGSYKPDSFVSISDDNRMKLQEYCKSHPKQTDSDVVNELLSAFLDGVGAE